MIDFTKQKKFDEVNQLYETFLSGNNSPNPFTIKLLLEANIGNPSKFEEIQNHIERYKIPFTRAIILALITGTYKHYGFDKSFEMLKKFQTIHPDLISKGYTVIISHFGKFGMIEQAEQLFEQVHKPVDTSVIVSLANVYFSNHKIEKAQELYKSCKKNSMVLNNIYLQRYAELGMMQEALEVFTKMSSVPNLTPTQSTYTALVKGFIKLGDHKEAVRIYNLCQLPPDYYFSTIGLKLFTSLLDMERSEQIFNNLLEMGHGLNVTFLNFLFEGYIKKKDWTEASLIPLRIKYLGLEPDDYTHYFLIKYSIECDPEHIMTHFENMKKPFFVAFRDIILYYVNLGKPEVAHQMYMKLLNSGVIIDSRWFIHTVLDSLLRGDMIIQAKEIIDHCYKRNPIDARLHFLNMSKLLKASSNSKNLKLCVELWHEMKDLGFSMSMYNWFSLIKVHISNAEKERAIELYDQVLKEKNVKLDQWFFKNMLFLLGSDKKVAQSIFAEANVRGIDLNQGIKLDKAKKSTTRISDQ